jgi:hypothetical protein
MSDSKPIKASNLKWLIALAITDASILILVTWSGDFTQAAALRGAAPSLLPVLVLITSNLLTAHQKAVLVYWDTDNPLPASRASEYAAKDARIDLAKLQAAVGVFPSGPREQNSWWYSLYLKVADKAAVLDSHGSYLLFRDMAAMSVLSLLVVPIALALFAAGKVAVWTAVVLFGWQYFFTLIAARNAGARLIATVLAMHTK